MNDKELHNWVKKLSLPVLEGGSAVRVKMNNSSQSLILSSRSVTFVVTLPDCNHRAMHKFQEIVRDGKIGTLEELVHLCTNIIFNCSAMHSTMHPPQYAFPLSQPSRLMGNPPENKASWSF